MSDNHDLNKEEKPTEDQSLEKETKDEKKSIFSKRFALKASLVLLCGLVFASIVFATVKYLPGFMPGFISSPEPLTENSSPQIINPTEEATKDSQKPNLIPVAASAIGDITIEAAQASQLGVDVDSGFIIKTKDGLSKEQLLASLFVKGGEAFDIDQAKGATDNEFVLTFKKPLEFNKIYNIEYKVPEKHPLSFAFQTASTFGITSTMPADDSHSVPLDSGIEVTFNEEVKGDFEAYFKIEPAVEGRFDHVGNTHIFIPEILSADTKYVVTIKKDIKSTAGEAMDKDVQFSFHTEWKQQAKSIFSIRGEVSETFLPDDDIFVEMYVTDVFRDKTFDVDIYDLKTAENYLNNQTEDNKAVNVPKYAELIETLQTDLYVVDNGEEYRNYYYIMLHKPLKEGYYLINIKTNHDNQEFSVKKLIQVSPLSVYSASLNGETCFWINDTATKSAATGAKINIDGKTGKTDADGKAMIKTVENPSSVVKIDYAAYPTYIYTNRTYDPKVFSAGEKYFTYIYTDRANYKPNDTIDVFGVIRERYGAFKLSSRDKITLKLGDMVEVPITLDEYGSYNVKIPVKNMHNYSSLDVYLNDDFLTSTGVEFLDYSKDKYIISAQTDRKAYFVNENADVDLFVTTYDQSPIEGVEIRDDYSDGPNLITKSDGTTSKTVGIARNSWDQDWRPSSRSLWFYISGSEDYLQSVVAPVIVLPSDVMLEDKTISENSIEFTSSLIDREAIEQYVQKSENNVYYVESDIYRGKSIDIDFTIQIYRDITTRVEVGNRYDFIQKINVPQYEYDYKEEYYDTYTARTVNGRMLVTDLPVSDDPLISHHGIVSFMDKSGRESSFMIYFGRANRSYRGESTNKDYYFELIHSTDQDDQTRANQLKLNETGQIKLDCYGADNGKEISKGKIMTILSHEKIINTTVGNPVGTPLTFTEDCINTSTVYGAYFDGRYIYPIEYPLTIYFDSDTRKLNFEISHDKETYLPGDEVTATIKVTDESGNPRKALVNLSVVDEAVFSENAHEANFLSGYYNSINFYNYSYFIYASYTQHEFSQGGGGAEQGGGGEDYIYRKDFRDNPAFKSMETDKNGVATVTFKLADAVTSWRITAHGITKDDFVGSTKTNIVATLPYYIDMVMSNEFVVGDEVSVLVKSLGNQYKLNQTNATYTIEVLKGNEIKFTETKPSLSYASFNAGKLPEGDYVVRIKSVAGDYKDAMEEKISVVKSGIRLPLKTEQRLSEDNPSLTSLDMMDSPVRVVLSNGDISSIMSILYSSMSYNSERTDYKAATAFGSYFLDGIYGNEQTPTYIEEIKNELSWHGGIPELVYGSGEPLYTARFAGSFPELIDKKELTSYMMQEADMYKNSSDKFKGPVTDESPESEMEKKRAAGYLALAAAGENVLLEIYHQLEVIKSSEDQEKFKNNYDEHLRVLFYAAALCTIGDDVRANELMNRYETSPELFKDSNDPAERELRAEYINTMQLFINSTVNPTQAYEYLKTKKNNNIYVSDVCEKINFIKKVVPLSGTVSEVQYTLNGDTKTAAFKNFDRISLNITKEQFEGLQLKQVSGNTEVKISFDGGVGNLNADNNKIKIQKQVLEKEKYKGEQTDQGIAKNLFYITFDVQMPADALSGYYTIRDRVPSNMRFTNSAVSGDRKNYYVNNIEKQLVDIGFYYDSKDRNVSVMYNAVKVNDAEAVIGKAYISGGFSLDTIWGESE